MNALPLAGLVLLAACSMTPREREARAAAAATSDDELAAELAGLTPGEPSDCLPVPVRQQVTTRAYGSTIVYRVSDGLKFRNDTNGGCEAAARGSTLVTRTPTGRACRGDIVQTFEPVSQVPTGSCSLGRFVPYRRP